MVASLFPISGDPRLKTAQWRALVAEWRKILRRDPAYPCQSPRCLLPGLPIRTEGKRGPDSLDVGHILDRVTDPRTTWTLDDTRAEHARCNRSAGTQVRVARQTGRPMPAPRRQAGEQASGSNRW